MKKSFLKKTAVLLSAVLALITCTVFGASADTETYYYGDLNGDNEVDVRDIELLTDHLLNKKPVLAHFWAGDINDDEKVDVSDLLYLKRLIHYGVFPGEPVEEPTQPNTHIVTQIYTSIVTYPIEVTTTTTTTTQVTTTPVTTTTTTYKVPTPIVTTAPDARIQSYIYNVFAQVNNERAKVGAKPLILNDTMCEAAMLRADEIANTFSHTRPDGSSCFTVLGDYGLDYSWVGENIAAGGSTPQEVMEQWLGSSGHYENIISTDYTELGVGVVYDPDSEYKYYWVQLFRAPLE